MNQNGADSDFSRQFMDGYRLITLNVLYYMPDQRNLVNEFFWQTLDLKPRYPRIAAFLETWRRDIDAVIKEIRIAESAPLAPARLRNATAILTLH